MNFFFFPSENSFKQEAIRKLHSLFLLSPKVWEKFGAALPGYKGVCGCEAHSIRDICNSLIIQILFYFFRMDRKATFWVTVTEELFPGNMHWDFVSACSLLVTFPSKPVCVRSPLSDLQGSVENKVCVCIRAHTCICVHMHIYVYTHMQMFPHTKYSKILGAR